MHFLAKKKSKQGSLSCFWGWELLYSFIFWKAVRGEGIRLDKPKFHPLLISSDDLFEYYTCKNLLSLLSKSHISMLIKFRVYCWWNQLPLRGIYISSISFIVAMASVSDISPSEQTDVSIQRPEIYSNLCKLEIKRKECMRA